MGDPELDRLIEDYNKLDEEWRQLDEQISNEPDVEVRSDLETQRNLKDTQRRALKNEIESRGGFVSPEPAPAETPPAPESLPEAAPEAAQIFLHAPPQSPDPEWNALVQDYERALADLANHATMKKDDWNHGDYCQGADHDQCSVWWKGRLSELIFWVRYTAIRLQEDLAGAGTQEEMAAGAATGRVREQIDEKNKEITAAEAKRDAYQAEYDQQYGHLTDQQVALLPSEIAGARSVLIYHLETAKKRVNTLYAERNKLLGTVLSFSGDRSGRLNSSQADASRRARGLDRARGRYGWEDVNLDINGLSDEELLKVLLGPKQYDQMEKETEKQGLQAAQDRRQSSRTGAGQFAPAVFLVILFGGDRFRMWWMLPMGAAIGFAIFVGILIWVLGDGNGDNKSVGQAQRNAAASATSLALAVLADESPTLAATNTPVSEDASQDSAVAAGAQSEAPTETPKPSATTPPPPVATETPAPLPTTPPPPVATDTNTPVPPTSTPTEEPGLNAAGTYNVSFNQLGGFCSVFPNRFNDVWIVTVSGQAGGAVSIDIRQTSNDVFLRGTFDPKTGEFSVSNAFETATGVFAALAVEIIRYTFETTQCPEVLEYDGSGPKTAG